MERLSFLELEGKVCYRSSQDGTEPEAMNYLELIARVTSRIPDKAQVIIRHYGYNAMPAGEKGGRRAFLF